jgi:acyl-CoA thioester hydrolase
MAHRYAYQIIFGDTDQMGVVYYGNYMRFFEGARASYWRSLGKTHKDLDDAQIALPVIEAHCNYKRPARYEDLIEVELRVAEVRAASIRFEYTVFRGVEVLADGYTRHAVIGPSGRPRALPDSMRALITGTPLDPR